MKVTYIGLGYIGLPTAILTAKSGLNTFGVDNNLDKVRSIIEGKVSSNEPKLKEYLIQTLESKKLNISATFSKSDVFIIVVPTPVDRFKKPDISIVKDAVKEITPFLEKGNLVIIESTCPVKTTEQMESFIYSLRPELKNDIHLAYCPERVIPGNIFHELEYNDRVVGGTSKESSNKAKSFYENFVKGEIFITNSRTAEMCKLTENASRDVQIAFANEISMMSDDLDIDHKELISLANKHPRVNILNPGIGVGGHCIAIDPWFLVYDFPNKSKLIKKAREVNVYKTEWCVNQIFNLVNEFSIQNNRKPKIGCFGLTYKPNVDDLRESPAVEIVSQLIDKKTGDILIVEPNVKSFNNQNLYDCNLAIEISDIIIFLVNHKEFKNLKITKNKIVFDLCGVNYFKE